jgi:hypothetical protein
LGRTKEERNEEGKSNRVKIKIKIKVKIKVEVKVISTLEQAMKAHRASKSITFLFL